MKKVIFCFSAILLLAFAIPADEMVWICATNMAYHRTNTCPQIKNCSSSQVTLSVAKNKGKNACSICFPKAKKQAVKKSTEKKSNETTTTATSSQATKTQKSTTKTQATKTKKK